MQKSGQVFSSLAEYLGADYVANFSRAKISAQLAELRFHLGLLNKSSQKDACDYMYMGRLSAQAEIQKKPDVITLKFQPGLKSELGHVQ